MTNFVAVQAVWAQTSADYHAERGTRTLILAPDTTVEEIMRWARSGSLLGRGDVVITEADAARTEGGG